MAYEIETDVPLPPRPGRVGGQETPRSTALRKLKTAKAGASVFLPGETVRGLNGSAHRILGPGNYTARQVDGGIRVWKR